jgi:hypothetical protein
MNTLRRIGISLLVLVAPIFGEAWGGFQSAPDISDRVSLVCRPSLDRSSRNPAVKTFVDLSLKPDHEVRDFTVIHELFDGTRKDRSDQYTGNVDHVPGKNEWSWNGRLNRNSSITMEARAFRTSRGEWKYEEKVYKNGWLDVAIDYSCNESEARE